MRTLRPMFAGGWLALFPAVALAQAPDAGAPHAHEAAAAAAPRTPEQQVEAAARQLFNDLLLADVRAVVGAAVFPFYLEGQRFNEPEALLQELLKQVRAKRTDLVTVQGVEVLTAEQMNQKYGKPPARLSGVPLRGNIYFAVANLSGNGAVAIFREVGGHWRVFAYHD